MNRLNLFLLIVLVSWNAWGRMVVPLMAPRATSSDSFVTQYQKSPGKRFRKERPSLGLELGTLAQSSENAADAIGMQMLYGARLSFQFSLWSDYFLKPSLGYWRRGESVGLVSVTQNIFEGGLAFHKILSQSAGSLWHAGIASHLDYQVSQISVQNSSANTPGDWRTRIGGALGGKWILDSDLDLTIDAEVGTSVPKPMKAYVGITAGVRFLLP